MGKVYLVGAGCGSFELLTLRGKRLIEKADCIIYDRLIDMRILDFAKPEVERIYLGKGNTEGGTLQERINKTIVEKAQVYKNVVRLKGGDSFVFGRGGEEIQAILEAGFDFEMVPGISSSLAVPQFAGIPVTHRGLSRSFHVFTAHFSDPEQSLDFDTISQLEGTLIFLMGVGNLKRIVEGLVQGGKNPDTPIAIIQKGARTRQKVVKGALDTIVSIAEREKVVPPAIILVGDVANLREDFMWYERLPLHDKKVLVTRSKGQERSLLDGLEELGGEGIHCPMVHIEQSEHQPNLEGINWILFNSPNGVHSFFNQIKDIREVADFKFGVVGAKTREALEKYYIQPDIMPSEYRSNHLIEEVLTHSSEDEGIILYTSQLTDLREDKINKMYNRQVRIHYSHYTQPVSYDSEELNKKLEDIDMVTFLSSSAAHQFFKTLADYKEMLNRLEYVSIGPSTTATIESYDQKVTYEAIEYTVEGILEVLSCISEHEH